MERESLKGIMISHCRKLTHSISERKIQTILPLSIEEIEQLKRSSGKADEEYLFADSSTGLGVNFFSIYKLCHKGCSINYEWKKESPLLIGGKSNLDIEVGENGIIKYYESKFLEPYYMSNSKFSKSYFLCDNYSFSKECSKRIIKFIDSNITDIKYYNISQLVRHLLAIVRFINNNQDQYDNKEVELISINWEMTDSFKQELTNIVSKRSLSYLNKRIITLENEKKKAEKYMNKLIDILNPELNGNIRLSFKTETYNEKINELEEGDHLKEFKKQYFL